MCLRIIHFEIFIHTSGNIIFKIIICLLLNTFLLFSTAFLSQEILGVRAHLSKYWRGTWPEKVLITPVLNPVPSPRRIFRVRSPPNKAPSPPNWNMKHYKSVEFLSIFRMSSHPAQTQSPPIENFLATVLPKPRRQTKRKCFLLWLIHNMVHWFACKQVKQNISRTVKWREQQQNISLLDVETVQKQKCSPNWRADRSGPEWRHR